MKRTIGNSDDMAKLLGVATFDDWLDAGGNDYIYEMYGAPARRKQELMYKDEELDPDDFFYEIEDEVADAQHYGETEMWKRFIGQMYHVANDLGTQLWLQFDHDEATDTWTVDVEENFDADEAAQALYALIMGIGFSSYANFNEFLADWTPLEEELPGSAALITHIPEVYGEPSIDSRMYDWAD